eukprot:CAMPEP_0174296980 /NCGR_PEP_ID=MMETSP0809-20121228/49612_1 /TAXON_ID=73025 ORGANISM="Eutreptiella gymnastica-like, Strain CCMP1594" /NCGR_SAMPLE_ID=MMETSP0809 /ASSEMBLY_ACC=CAM_ASM_000658 /LENGTH=251 /DNA_ID=CAMNT_0015400407 /DNA_START=19 /DNA_END=774 /DNA_ORIENTATION=-
MTENPVHQPARDENGLSASSQPTGTDVKADEDKADKSSKGKVRVLEGATQFNLTHPIPIDDQTVKHPLWCRWSIWYDGPAKKTTLKNWSDNLKEVYTFDTVEDFWSVYNNIQSPCQLPPGSNYHLFKHGIKPMWEHEANRRGGKWIIQFPHKLKGRIDKCWLFLSLALIGEHFQDGDEVCGGVVSVRKQNSRLSLWTRTAKDRDMCIQIGRQLRTLLGVQDIPEVKLIYQSHGDALQNDSSFGNKPLYCID